MMCCRLDLDLQICAAELGMLSTSVHVCVLQVSMIEQMCSLHCMYIPVCENYFMCSVYNIRRLQLST